MPEQPALPCVAGGKTVIQEMKNLEIADQAPLGLIDETRRHLSGDTLYVQIRTETLQNIYHKIQILRQIQTQEIIWDSRVLLLDARPLDQLQLVELHGMKRKGTDERTLVHKH